MVSLGGVIQKPDLTGNEGFKISYDQIVFAVAPQQVRLVSSFHMVMF